MTRRTTASLRILTMMGVSDSRKSQRSSQFSFSSDLFPETVGGSVALLLQLYNDWVLTIRTFALSITPDSRNPTKLIFTRRRYDTWSLESWRQRHGVLVLVTTTLHVWYVRVSRVLNILRYVCSNIYIPYSTSSTYFFVGRYDISRSIDESSKPVSNYAGNAYVQPDGLSPTIFGNSSRCKHCLNMSHQSQEITNINQRSSSSHLLEQL